MYFLGRRFHTVSVGHCATSGLAGRGEGNALPFQLHFDQSIPAVTCLGLLEGWGWVEVGESSVACWMFGKMVRFLI